MKVEKIGRIGKAYSLCRRLAQFLGALEIIPLNAEIARQGGLYRRNYGPSHGVGLADALIAASATLHQAQLVTLNARHFPMLQVEVAYTKT